MTLYALRPDPASGSLDDAEVVAQSRYGWEYLKQAISLWRLVDSDRADGIEAIKERVLRTEPDEELRLYTPNLQELVHLLTGVEDAIIAAGIVNHQWRVAADRLEELSKRVPSMDLATERPLEDKTFALGEVMSNAISIRHFLANALDAGCVVVLG